MELDVKPKSDIQKDIGNLQWIQKENLKLKFEVEN